MRYAFAMAVAAFACSAPVYSQSNQTACLQALVQDRGFFNLHDVSSLATARLIQQTSGSKSGWGAAVTIPIQGVPVQFGANEAESATNSYFDNSTTQFNSDRLLSIVTQTLSDNALQAYKACVHETRSSGPTINVHDATATSVTLSVHWVAAPMAPASASGSVRLYGGHALAGFPSHWVNNQTVTAVVQRAAGKDLRIVANIGAQSEDEFIAALPPPPPPPIAPTIANQLYLGLTPNVNAGEISNASFFKNGTNIAIGNSIQAGPLAGAAVYLGQVAYVNAGMVNTSQNSWRGGATVPFGFLVAIGKQSIKDIPLYVGIDQRCAGAVANNPGHQGCAMQLLGYAYVP